MKCALALFLVTVAGCGGTDPGDCTPMQMPGDLAQRAALLRLDVFDGDVHCDGATVTGGASAPSMSKAAPAGQPIHLDIPEGAHTLLLTAYGDATGTDLIASACTEANLSAGASVCFNLTLVEAPDLATPRVGCNTAPDDCPMGQFCAVDGKCAPGCKTAPDCAGNGAATLCKTDEHRCVECLVPNDCPAGKRCSPSGACVDGCDVAAGSLCAGSLMCCSNLCIDTQSELSSCGGCGRPCSGTNVAAPSCSGGQCAPTCASGWGDCSHPIAPAADDGCETNFNDASHCGSCNKVCALPHAINDCPAGNCTIKSCSASYFNCDAQTANGCECPGADLADGMNGCCAGGTCQAQHGTGLGQTFYDCIPFGTYSLALAKDAAKAYNLAGQSSSFCDTDLNCGGSPTYYCVRRVMGTATKACACWGFAGGVVGLTSENKSGDCVALTLPWK